jgi:Holliday junction DNA helicase RuvA
MIASLKGKVEALGNNSAVISVNGIGFQVYLPTSTLSTIGTTGEEVKLYTHLYLRDDNATLYGFASAEELGLFQVLIGVSGLGPRLALATLSVMNPEQLSMAIASGSADMLIDVPGIGKKMANRLILELKDKISAGWATAPTTQLAQENADAITALTSLGYSVAEATRAVVTLPSDQSLKLEEKIKLALQQLGEETSHHAPC